MEMRLKTLSRAATNNNKTVACLIVVYVEAICCQFSSIDGLVAIN